MAFLREDLGQILDRTDGYCHICHKKLCRNNYAQYGRRGAWEVEHSNPRACGGTNRLCNLYAACVGCNRQKGTLTTRTARRWNGKTKAPLSKTKKNQIRTKNRWGLGALGAAAGAAVGGPIGFAVGGALGALIGHDIKPE